MKQTMYNHVVMVTQPQLKLKEKRFENVSQHSPCLVSRTIFRKRDVDPDFLTAAEVGGDGDNDSDPILLLELNDDEDTDFRPGFFIAAGGDEDSNPGDIGVECVLETHLFNFPCVGGAGEILSLSERGGDDTGGLLSLRFDALLDKVCGEDELRTIFLGLAGRLGGEE